jgi:hypothetical protein
LTDEQRARIAQNRLLALEKKRQRELAAAAAAAAAATNV